MCYTGENKHPYLCGIVSFGFECARFDFAGVNEKIICWFCFELFI